jgi:L-threonylcarbamoyladenylate synthase
MKYEKEIVAILKNSGIGVIPTDTVYGVVASAFSRKAVLRIYKVRRRTPTKPMIVLIGTLRDLRQFGVRPSPKERKVLTQFWPGPVSIILPCRARKFFYLHRGSGGIAFRLPKPVWLRKFLEKTGPLVAPSANPEGAVPAKTITQAKKYFGNSVDFYVDGGRIVRKPSRLLRIGARGIRRLR